MEIRNEMESLVRAEFSRIKAAESGDAGAARCWCTLCETDVVALALTLLPPLYCRGTASGYAPGLHTPGKIHDAVQSALLRVNLRPKHRSGESAAARAEVSLVNYTMEVGSEMVGRALGRSERGCACQECRSDALAYALNRYPPKYGVARSGRRTLQPTYLEFMRHELGMLVLQAARVVSAHPNHP
jgi:hypothetical protein